MFTAFLFGLVGRVWTLMDAGEHIRTKFFPKVNERSFWRGYVTLLLLVFSVVVILDLILIIIALRISEGIHDLEIILRPNRK